MNRTQKGALLNLSAFLVSIAFLSYLFITIFALRSLPNRTAVMIWLLTFSTLFGWWVLLLRKRQNPSEPEADERDKAIMRNAVLVSFISTWLLLAAATLIPALVLGESGSVPVYILTFINFGVFLVAGLVYTVAILVQNRCGSNNE
jgi:RsiW-degrading membrane proteinase PrsW (M82 family)